MPKLQNIPSFPRDAADLLEAVGYMTARELSEVVTHELIEEMLRANAKLRIMESDPSIENLEKWKHLATQSLNGKNKNLIESTPQPGHTTSRDSSTPTTPAESQPSNEPVNFENDPEVQEMLHNSPYAELVPVDLMKHHQVSAKSVTEGVLLTECAGEVEINVMSSQQKAQLQRKTEEMRRRGLMTSRIRSFDQAQEGEHHVKPLEKGQAQEVTSLSEGLNKGLTPESRRFIRGVLHTDPWRVRTSGIAAVMVQIFLAGVVLFVPGLIAYDYLYAFPDSYWWVVAIVSCFLLTSIGYLAWGLSARCCVCGQRQFAPKKCLKNRKAHHVPLLGYIFPTAIHALLYHWFYCTYCGTAVRLKK